MSETRVLATADQLRNASCRSVRRFRDLAPLPVSGLSCRIRSVTKKELSDFQMAVMDGKGRPRADRIKDAENRLFVLCLVDGDGNPLLTQADVGIFEDWDSADTQFLYNECSAFAGLNRDDLETLTKN